MEEAGWSKMKVSIVSLSELPEAFISILKMHSGIGWIYI